MAGRTRPEPYFLTEKPDDDVALAGAEARAGQLKIFKQYCFDPSEVEGGEILGNRDHDRETARLSQLAGINKRAAEEGIYAYQTLRRLPRLREMQLATARLDLDRLSAVAAAIGCLGPDAPAEAYEAFDDALVEMLTPVKTRQALPARNTITLRLNKMIGDFDTEAAFDLAKKKNRKRTTPGAPQIDFGPGAAGSDEAWMTLSADNASIAALRSNINEAARKRRSPKQRPQSSCSPVTSPQPRRTASLTTGSPRTKAAPPPRAISSVCANTTTTAKPIAVPSMSKTR